MHTSTYINICISVYKHKYIYTWGEPLTCSSSSVYAPWVAACVFCMKVSRKACFSEPTSIGLICAFS